MAVVRAAVTVAEERSLRSVRAVRVEVGDLTLLNPDQLKFCFQVAAKGTLAEGAALRIERAPAILACQRCDSKFEWKLDHDDPAYHFVPPLLRCSCGSPDIKVVSGRELKVVSITAESQRPRGVRSQGKGHG